MENSVYYNSKFLKVTDKIEIENGYKGGEQVTISDSDFVSVTAPEMGTDFHTVWRNADGSVNVHGFMQLVSSSEFTGIGASLENEGTSVEPSVSETTTKPAETTAPTETTTKTAETTAPIETTAKPAETTVPSETTKSDDTSSIVSGDIILGDANCDGLVDVRDVTTLKQSVVKLISLDDSQKANADVISDGVIDVKDLGQLIKYIIKIIDKF
jgi:hypothetical protein